MKIRCGRIAVSLGNKIIVFAIYACVTIVHFFFKMLLIKAEHENSVNYSLESSNTVKLQC